MILDQAEALFADAGYDGTSIRDIAKRSGVHAAVLRYHFGRKKDLFAAVIVRRLAVVNAARADDLTRALAVSKGRPVALESLIRLYVGPLVEAAGHGDAGWRRFAALLGRLAYSSRGSDAITQHFDTLARRYLVEFERTLPELPKESLVDGFLYMVSIMLFVSAGTGRAQRLQGSPHRGAREPTEALATLVPFVRGGFQELSKLSRRSSVAPG
jgi:AcrR family transcriptional regulator